MLQEIIELALVVGLIIVGFALVLWIGALVVSWLPRELVENLALWACITVGVALVAWAIWSVASAIASISLHEFVGFALFLVLWAAVNAGFRRIWPPRYVEPPDDYFRRVVWPSFWMSMVVAGAIPAAAYALIFAG